MKSSAEALAQSLQQLIEEQLRGVGDPVSEISVRTSGQGGNSQCEASSGDSRCCTGIVFWRDMPPGYQTTFERSGAASAWGQSSSEADVASAMADWLKGFSLPELYRRHAFVDQGRRAIAAIADEISARHPALLAVAPPVITADKHSQDSLRFGSGSRSCVLSSWAREIPMAVFFWDGSELFRFEASDTRRLGAVLEHWIVAESPPSRMRAEFPWLEIGPLADYYENGNPAEGEFLQSWDQIEEIYRDPRYSMPAEILPFIAEMREQGFDRKLRIGQSMWTMILSRARLNGLKPEEPAVAFNFIDGRIQASCRVSENDLQTTEVSGIKLHPEIEGLLRWLENQAIS